MTSISLCNFILNFQQLKVTMQVFELNRQNSVAHHFLAELRDVKTQNDRLRFRKNLERLGEIMAYEISKSFKYSTSTIQTPLAPVDVKKSQLPVIITVLRAGLPYFEGFLNFFDGADCGFIGAYRKEGKEITVNLDYLACPSLEGKEIILVDPMLATGNSVIQSWNALLKHGVPSHIYIASLVAAPEGVDKVRREMKTPASLWTVCIDQRLNKDFYIVPGLGDAGDLSFGEKM
jgi:uracil phosphoribosyltransferase